MESDDTSGNEPDSKPFFNRELSWLEFNRRVLDEATDGSLPVLERLKFLSIFSTNLDEFFMIRISGLKEQIAEGVGDLSADGMTASEQLQEIYKRLRPMRKRQVSYLHANIFPALKEAGITIESYAGLNTKEKKLLDKYFHNNLFPILTPQSVDSSHPFPYVSNLSVNLGLFIEPNRAFTQANLKHLFRQKRFTRIKLPRRYLFAHAARPDKRSHDRRVFSGSIETYFYRLNIWILGRLGDKIGDGAERIIRMMQ